MRLERERTTTIPNGSIFMFRFQALPMQDRCQYSMIVRRYQIAAAARAAAVKPTTMDKTPN